MTRNKKKLLITASTFPRWENDTEPRFILDYAKAMSEYMDVTVLAPAAIGAKKRERIEGVNVIRYHYFPIHKWETLCYPGAIVPRIKQRKVRALLVPFLFISLLLKVKALEKNFDVVHAHWIIPQGLIQPFCKKPYLITGHGGDVTSLNFNPVRGLKRKALCKAAAVTAVSKPLLSQCLQIEGISSNREPDAVNKDYRSNTIYNKPIHEVISMGVDTSNFSRNYRIENYFSQDNRKVVLFVGRLAEKKGVRYLIESCKYLPMEEVKLIIVGDGPLREELEKQSKDLVNELITKNSSVHDNCIEFLGPKTHEELKTIYASADIFAMPSITAKDGDKEGFGLVMLEAFASGLPVVASASGGIVDLVRDGYNGFLVSEKDSKGFAKSLIKLLADQKLYSKISENGLATANIYDYKEIAKKYTEIIEKFI